jgi:uncharacterized membrane protein
MKNTLLSFLASGWKGCGKKELILTAGFILVTVALLFVPTGFEQAVQGGLLQVRGEVTAVDNSGFHVIGLTKTGEQIVFVLIKEGPFAGEQFVHYNHFIGKLDLDRVYKPGDQVFLVLETDNGNLVSGNIVDRYRLKTEMVLVAVFVVFLVLFAGWTGIKAVLSFFFTIVVLWKILLPGYLKLIPPLPLTLAVTGILTAGIIFLVAGFSRKGWTAFLGALSGVILTGILSLVFGRFFRIPGEILPWSEVLLYTGFIKLRMGDLFLSGIILAASGAVMDIATDIAASLDELHRKRPDLSRLELILSGFAVGRSVIGTMTTTLLLAYSGGYMTLLMAFMAQGVPLANILNIQYVAAEILHTVVGSFGLVAVAPLTAILGGLVYKPEKKPLP